MLPCTNIIKHHCLQHCVDQIKQFTVFRLMYQCVSLYVNCFLDVKRVSDVINTHSSGTTITHLRCGWFGCIRCTGSLFMMSAVMALPQLCLKYVNWLHGIHTQFVSVGYLQKDHPISGPPLKHTLDHLLKLLVSECGSKDNLIRRHGYTTLLKAKTPSY